MGELLDRPILERDPSDTEAENMVKEDLKYGVRSVQGWRRKMEDTYLCAVDVPVPPNEQDAGVNIAEEHKIKKCHIFGVFDGHGGKEVALYVKRHFVDTLINLPSFKEEKYEEALKGAFLAIDEKLKLFDDEVKKELNEISEIEKEKEKQLLEQKLYEDEKDAKGVPLSEEEKQQLAIFKSIFDPRNLEDCNVAMFTGCAACVALIIENTLYIANVGDCRCVVASKTRTVSFFTKDHKPSDPDEKNRIELAEGFVDNSNSRLNGVLSLSRAIGDLEYKKSEWLKPEDQIITANPDVSSVNITNVDYILIGCDGIWESKDNKDVVGAIDAKVFDDGDEGDCKYSEAIEKLFKELIRKPNQQGDKGSKGNDNMTLIIVKVKDKYKELNESFATARKEREKARKNKKEEEKRIAKELSMKKAKEEREKREREEKEKKEKKEREKKEKEEKEKGEMITNTDEGKKKENKIFDDIISDDKKEEVKTKVEDNKSKEEKPKEEEVKKEEVKEEVKKDEKSKEVEIKQEDKPKEEEEKPKEEEKKEEGKTKEEIKQEENIKQDDKPKDEIKQEEEKKIIEPETKEENKPEEQPQKEEENNKKEE